MFTNVSFSAFTITLKDVSPVIADSCNFGGSEGGLFLKSIGNFIKRLFGGGSSSPPPSPPPLSVTITKDGEAVVPNKLYYIEKGESAFFDVTFSNYNTNPSVAYTSYDPFDHVYYGKNNRFYSVTQDNGPLGTFAPEYRLEIHRGESKGTGYDYGAVDFVMFFGQNAVINGSTAGIVFQEPGFEPQENNSLFVFHFTVVKPD